MALRKICCPWALLFCAVGTPANGPTERPITRSRQPVFIVIQSPFPPSVGRTSARRSVRFVRQQVVWEQANSNTDQVEANLDTPNFCACKYCASSPDE